MVSLSVIVITKNEAHNIHTCLQALAFADQRVVLDSGSQDATCKIARALGAEVSLAADWQGFGIQKNRALALSTCDWVLSIDADEIVTPQLREQIMTALAAPQFDVYAFPRLSSYCGQYMLHSGWYPDRVTRLFKRGAANFSNDQVHERLVTSCPVGQLTANLLHHSFIDFESVLNKVNHYSSAGAQRMQLHGKTATPLSAVMHGCWTFFRSYVLRRGFLDGSMGLVLAISNAEGSYYRYLKLWLMQRNLKKIAIERRDAH